MHDIDRVAHIQPLPQPARARRPRVEMKSLPLVLRAERPHRIGRHCYGRRNFGQEPAVRPPEPERFISLPLDVIPLLVNRAVMPATEQREI